MNESGCKGRGVVATRSSAWQSWHDPPQKTEVCLSLSAGPGKALEASCASLPSPPLAGKARRVTDAHDWRGFPRTREDIAHPYWLLANPYSVFIRWLIRRPLDPSPLSLSLRSISFLFRRRGGSMQLTLPYTVTGIFSMHFTASFHLSPDISKQIFF